MPRSRSPRGLPSREEVLELIAASPVPLGPREIARAFKVDPADRVALRSLIRNVGERPVRGTGRRRSGTSQSPPDLAVIEVVTIDVEGEPVCRIVDEPPGAEPSPVRLATGRGGAALGIGDEAVARLRPDGEGGFVATVVRKLGADREHAVGLFTPLPHGGGQVSAIDRRDRTVYSIAPSDGAGAVEGELVVIEPIPRRRLGLAQARVVERVGPLDDPRTISLVAIHTHRIPVEFSHRALDEAAAAAPVELGERTDLRQIPLVTIDGADARDFDDAVWAEPDPDEPGGWHLIVAIADVAWYVRPASALDDAALERGNSVYFPDRVVPMLPEALSNELCSLKPGVERACVAFHIWIDASGRITRHQAIRGLMRSAARLTYEEVQAAWDGLGREAQVPRAALAPLYGAFAALAEARRERGTLELDLPERRVTLGPDGAVEAITVRQRLDSHRLIEEFMIAANVAAAETLEKARRPCMYRVHDAPDPVRVDALRHLLEGIGIQGLKLARGQVLKPRHFAKVLEAARGRPEERLISELVLRCQDRAAYSPDNIGHFGLALRRYAHFTSPIRRYADLLVHRALIEGLGLGQGGLPATTGTALAELGRHISFTERRATQAERMAMDRYAVAYLRDHVGATFSGRISGVAKFGLFVSLDETGADGLVPRDRLPNDEWRHDESRHALVGRRTRRAFTLGERVQVRLVELDPVSAGLVLELEGVEARSERAPARRALPRGKVGARASLRRKSS